jgi:DNA-binding CsgD family transcriptional regulator
MTKTPLSGRELQCLEWVSLGKTSWETASILGLSERTVNFHLRNACRKLNVYGRQAGVVKAVRLGLLHTVSREPSENTSSASQYPLISEPVTA